MPQRRRAHRLAPFSVLERPQQLERLQDLLRGRGDPLARRGVRRLPATAPGSPAGRPAPAAPSGHRGSRRRARSRPPLTRCAPGRPGARSSRRPTGSRAASRWPSLLYSAPQPSHWLVQRSRLTSAEQASQTPIAGWVICRVWAHGTPVDVVGVAVHRSSEARPSGSSLLVSITPRSSQGKVNPRPLPPFRSYSRVQVTMTSVQRRLSIHHQSCLAPASPGRGRPPRVALGDRARIAPPPDGPASALAVLGAERQGGRDPLRLALPPSRRAGNFGKPVSRGS
jgi:hypothetical protein